MINTILVVLGGIAAAFALVAIIFVLGMRSTSGLVQGGVIWMGKHGFNQIGLQTAGAPGASAARIVHRGRVSGATYETPVGAIAVDGSFLISLPYELRSNWLRNVLAAGTATLVHEGQAYTVDAPEIVLLAPLATAFAAAAQATPAVDG